MKGLVAGYASSGDEASSSDDEPAKPPRAAVREGPRAGRRESRWAIQARAIKPMIRENMLHGSQLRARAHRSPMVGNQRC